MIGQWKGKVELEDLESGGTEERRKRKRRKRRLKEDGGEGQGLDKPQVLRDLIDGKQNNVVIDLPNLGMELVFQFIEL